MKDNNISRNSGFMFWGIIPVSFIYLGMIVYMLNGCSGKCATNIVQMVQSPTAVNSFHQIDLTNPDQSFLTVWSTYGL